MNKIVARKVNECEKKKLPPTPKKNKAYTKHLCIFLAKNTLFTLQLCERGGFAVGGNWKLETVAKFRNF